MHIRQQSVGCITALLIAVIGAFVDGEKHFMTGSSNALEGQDGEGLLDKTIITFRKRRANNRSKNKKNKGKTNSAQATCQGTEVPMTPIETDIKEMGNGLRRITAMYISNPNPTNLRLIKNPLLRNADLVLDNWLNGVPSDRPKGKTTEQTNGDIRLDRQGITQTTNYGNLVNWQLQINGKNLKRPTSVAQVNMLENFRGIAYYSREWQEMMVRGMKESLKKAATVWIFQKLVGKNENFQCPILGRSN